MMDQFTRAREMLKSIQPDLDMDSREDFWYAVAK